MSENRVASAGDIVKFRQPRQKSEVKIYIRKPTSVYTATLSAIPTDNDMVTEISFTGGAGTLSNVKVNMAILIGTTVGGHELGFARIRKTPIAGTFYIGETSEVNWSAGGTIYLTVVNDTIGIWPKHLVLVSQVPYMDVDVVYSNQHTNFDPVVIMGTDRVAVLSGATVVQSFDASASWVYGSTISSYLWSFPGASGTSGLTTATPTATYNAQGEYQAYCTVTAATGKTHTGVRTVFVDAGTLGYDGQLTTNPIGSLGEGGWSCDVTVSSDISDLMDFTKVVVATIDYYEDVQSSVGPISGSENIELIGWIVEESVEHNPKMQYTKFRIATANMMIQNIAGFIHGLEIAPTASNAWTNMAGLTVDRSLWHMFHWRSTVDHCVDIKVTEDTRYIKETTTPAGNLWQQFTQLLGLTIAANLACDRYSRVIAQIEPQLVPVASRTWSTVRTLQDQDWHDDVTFQMSSMSKTGRVYLDGVSISSEGQGQAYFSLAPGHTPKRFGNFDSMPSLLLSSQAQANALAGAILAWRNNRYKDITVDLAANDKYADIVPNMYYAATFTDTRRNRTITGNFIPRRVERVWNKDTGALTTSVSFELATTPDINANGDIPDGGGTIPQTPFHPQVPSFPPIGFPQVPGQPGSTDPRYFICSTTNFGILYTNTFDAASPQWFFMNAGLTTTEKNSVRKIVKCPSGAIFILTSDGTFDVVYFASSLGDIWTKVFSADDLPADGQIIAMGVNPTLNEQIAIFGGQDGTTNGYVFMGDRDGLTQAAAGMNNRLNRYGDISYGAGAWLLTHSRANIFTTQHWIRMAPSGALQAQGDIPGGSNATHHWHARGGTTEHVIEWDPGGAGGYRKFTGNGATIDSYGSPEIGNNDGSANWKKAIALSPSGQRAIGGQSPVILQRTSDYGVTFGPVDVSLGVGYSVVENCNSEDAFVVCTTQSVKYTSDWGTTWVDKSGNIASVAPLCVIRYLIFIGW